MDEILREAADDELDAGLMDDDDMMEAQSCVGAPVVVEEGMANLNVAYKSED